MRLQVTVLPFARNQPYDVYADITFSPPLAELKPGVADTLEKTQEKAKKQGSKIKTPIIVPLLVTDTAELSPQSRAIEMVQQLSGALSGQLYNIGASGNLSGLRDEIAAVLGNDMNALFTVAQLKWNVARVRLGAVYQASSKYAMLPRANTVTLLVLVPGDEIVGYEPRFLPIALRTRLRNAQTGKILPDVDKDYAPHRKEQIAEIIGKYCTVNYPCGEGPSTPEQMFRKLNEFVGETNYDEFIYFVRNPSKASLWQEVSDLRAGYGYSTTEVELPRRVLPRLPEPQLALISDDTSSNATVRLAGGRTLIADQVRATLVLPGRSTGKPRQLGAQDDSPGGERRLPAQSVTKSGDDLVLSFPSLAAWKLVAEKGGKPASDGIKIQVSLPDHMMKSDGGCQETPRGAAQAGSEGPCKQVYDVAYVAKAPKTLDVGFSTISPVRTVAIGEKGTGSYRFALTLGDAKKVLLRGDGVAVSKVEPAVLVDKDYAWQLASSGLVTVTFDQLTPGQQFKLVLTGIEGRTQEISVEAKKSAADDKKSEGVK